ncbi:MAG: hypothetical protein JAZ06_02445 [Candidatus Thiodiazotropha taylori]|nr:hypothetical protein [Candidatus Thiodiazotropha taylori]
MWKQVAIDKSKKYVLNLCQDSKRFCRICELVSTENQDCLVFATEVIPNELIENYGFSEIERNYKTSDGRCFYFGSHGEWLVDVEYEAFANVEPIPWVTEEPGFAPR